MNRSILALLLPALLLAGDEINRPKILGVAHMALYVSDLAKASKSGRLSCNPAAIDFLQ